MIYVECKPDEALVRHLTGFARRQVAHEFKGEHEVCKRVRAQQGSKGLVDEDPGSPQPPYFGETILAVDRPELGLKVFDDKRRANRIVVLRPKLEDWILDTARGVSVDVRQHNLPNRPSQLHGVINANLAKFERLLEELLASSSERLDVLRQLLTRR